MRRTRHVVLPVRSWQYMGLLIVSLACLTLGHVSRDREGRHGSLAGPELMHTAPHEVDACPNENCSPGLASSDGSSLLKPSDLATPIESRIASSRSTRTVRDSRLTGPVSRSDVTRLISNEVREQRRVVDERRVRSAERRNTRLVRSLSQEVATRRFADERRVRSQERRDSRLRTRSVDRIRMAELRENKNSRVEPRVAQLQRDIRMERRSLVDEGRTRVLNSRVVRERDTRAERRVMEVREKREVQMSLDRDSRTDRRSANRVRVAENRLDSRADRRSVSAERRVRDSRIERRSANEEQRVRLADNRRVRDVESERRARDFRFDRRSISEERRVRLADNRRVHDAESERRARDFRVDRRSVSEERRIRLTDNRRVRDAESERRAHDSRFDRRSVSEERRIRLADNRRVRDVESERRVRNSRVERRSVNEERRIRLNDNRRVRDSMNERRNTQTERQIRAVENQQVRDTGLVREQRKFNEDAERRVRLVRDAVRLENRRARSVENIRVHERRRQLSRLDRRARSVEDVRALSSRREASRLAIRENERDNRLRVARSENRRTRSAEDIRVRESRLVREVSRRFAETSRRNSASRREIRSNQRAEENSRLVHENRMRINREAEDVRRSTRIVDDKQSERRVARQAAVRDADQRHIRTARDYERRNLLVVRRSDVPVARRVRDVFAEQLKRKAPREIPRLDQRRVSDKRFADTRREKQSERHVDERFERVNIKNDLVSDVRMKAMSMKLQYLKNVMPVNNLNYEILRQAVVIALCAIYGASIFNSKSGPFRNLAEYGSRLAVW